MRQFWLKSQARDTKSDTFALRTAGFLPRERGRGQASEAFHDAWGPALESSVQTDQGLLAFEAVEGEHETGDHDQEEEAVPELQLPTERMIKAGHSSIQ